MNKFIITEEERSRILGMHKSRTSKLYLSDKSKLMEGTGPNETWWKQYMNGTTVGDFGSFIPSTNFLNPATGKQWMFEQSDGKQLPLYIGAYVSAKYDSKIPAGGSSLQDSKRFFGSITFYYTITAGVKDYTDQGPGQGTGAKGVAFFTIKIAQLKNGKCLFVPISQNKNLPIERVVEGTTTSSLPQIAQTNVFGQNISGYNKSLYAEINKLIDTIGFSLLPNSVTGPVTA